MKFKLVENLNEEFKSGEYVKDIMKSYMLNKDDLLDILDMVGYMLQDNGYDSLGIREIQEYIEDNVINEAAEIEVENPGLLEVPKGKKVDELPLSHFEKLVDKKGYEAVIKGLNNLAVWNKNDDKKLSNWAKDTMEKLKEKFRKDESLETDNADFIVNVYEVDDDSENFDKLEGGIEEDVGVTVNDVYNRYNKKYIDKLISDIVLEEVEDGEMPKGQLSQLISNVAHEKFWKEHRNVHHMTGPVQVINKNLFDSGVKRLSKKLGRILLPPR